MTNLERWKEEFEKIFREYVKRDGAEAMLDWLEETDFFTAPAGAKHHGAYPGGLVKHSLNVYWKLMEDREAAGVGDESKAVCALLHDVCKVGVYHKAEGGGYFYADDLPLGHGEKSVYLISRFMWLTDEEALAIRWHMGAYDRSARGGSKELSEAQDYSPLVYSLHDADMRAMLAERQEVDEYGRPY